MIVENLMPNMSGKINFVCNPVKSIGYYSHKTNKKSQSISIHTLNFVGRFILEGSLKLNPLNDSDWFIIPLKDNLPYIEYNDYSYMNQNVIRKNNVYTFFGNYVWLRAKLDRSYLNILQSSVQPYDLHSSNVITANSNINLDTTNAPYPTAPLNPKDDPEYYDGWTPNFALASNRRVNSSRLGNIEKVLLCY